MDGNGRWAVRRGLARSAGHRAGVQAVRRVVEAAPDCGIKTLTLFAFSSDNWMRPRDEVKSLMWMLRGYLRGEARRFIDSGARLIVIGRRDRLAAQLRAEIHRVEHATADGRRLTVRALSTTPRGIPFSGPQRLCRQGEFRRARISRVFWPGRLPLPIPPRRLRATSTCLYEPAAISGCPISCCGNRHTRSCSSAI